FARIRHENIIVRQNLRQPVPAVVRIVVGIESNRQTSALELSKQIGDLSPQTTLQIVRTEMEVPGVGKIVKIQIFKRQLSDRPQISDDVPPTIPLQNYRQACRCLRAATQLRNIHSRLYKPLHRNLAERVVPNKRD